MMLTNTLVQFSTWGKWRPSFYLPKGNVDIVTELCTTMFYSTVKYWTALFSCSCKRCMKWNLTLTYNFKHRKWRNCWAKVNRNPQEPSLKRKEFRIQNSAGKRSENDGCGCRGAVKLSGRGNSRKDTRKTEIFWIEWPV